ncbi:MAG: helix-turn-helix transcriptional regulator [Phycisphaerales bacterium]|nr:helix-turn-helix transcriptional regulator [Phycisphaerales bacterium]
MLIGKPSAGLIDPAPCPMPANVTDNAIVREVLVEAGLSQVSLASAMGCSESYVTRVLDGQFAVPAQMLRSLWRMTRDERLITIALGVGARELVPASQLDRHLDNVRDKLASVQNALRAAQSALPSTGTAPRLDMSA